MKCLVFIIPFLAMGCPKSTPQTPISTLPTQIELAEDLDILSGICDTSNDCEVSEWCNGGKCEAMCEKSVCTDPNHPKEKEDE